MAGQLVRRLTIMARVTARRLREPLRDIARTARRTIILALQVVAALILLFEEWGWRPLVAALEQLSRFAAWRRLELLIAGLPPYAALAALALPTTLLLPLKFLSIYLLANGHFLTAGALFVAAKIGSTALIARVFLLTKPALMRIGWFQRGYDWVMPWKDALFASIRTSWPWRYGRMLKTRATHETKQAWSHVRPSITVALKAAIHEAHEIWGQLKSQMEHQAIRMRLALRRTLGRG